MSIKRKFIEIAGRIVLWTVGCLVCAAVVGLIDGCGPGSPASNFVVYLPNHYRLIANNAEDVSVHAPIYRRGQMIAPCIVELRVVEHLVYGRTVISSRDDSQAGFFILDTRSHKVWQGLPQERWRRELQERWGVTDFSLCSPGTVYRERVGRTRKLAQEAVDIYVSRVGRDPEETVSTQWGWERIKPMVALEEDR